MSARTALVACLVLGACSSTPRAVEIEIDNQLGATPVTLWANETFNGFPMVSGWTTAMWEAPPGKSTHQMDACLPLHVGRLELTQDNADREERSGLLRYTIELRPMPEGGALRTPKLKGAAGISLFSGPLPDQDKERLASNVAEFDRAVARAGSRKKLGCWGAGIFGAMDAAKD